MGSLLGLLGPPPPLRLNVEEEFMFSSDFPSDSKGTKLKKLMRTLRMAQTLLSVYGLRNLIRNIITSGYQSSGSS